MICNLTGATPQLVHILRTRQTAGLAPTGLWLGVIGTTLWLGYGYAASDLPLLALNVVTGTIAVVVLASYVRLCPQPIPAQVNGAALLLLACIIATALSGNHAALALAGSALNLLWGIPQLLALLRSSSVSGVSSGAYVVSVIGGVAWTIRWALEGNLVVTATTMYGLALNVAALTLLLHRPKVAAAYRRSVAVLPTPVTRPLLALRGAGA